MYIQNKLAAILNSKKKMIPFDFGITDIGVREITIRSHQVMIILSTFKVLSALKIEFNGSS